MSAPFVGHRVEITGTSRADLNGKKGLAVFFDDNKGRYRVHVRGQDLYLKPSNLLQAKETGTPSSMQEAKELAEEVFDEFAAKLKDVLPDGFGPRDAALAAGGFVLLWKTAGFLRAAALAVVAFVGLFGGAVDAFKGAGGGLEGAKAGAEAAGAFAAAQASARAGRPVTTRHAQYGLVALVAVAFAAGGRRAAPPPPPPPPPPGAFPDYEYDSSADPEGTAAPMSARKEAYALGFEDARAGRDFGASLVADPDYAAPPPGERVPRGGPPSPTGFGYGAISKLMSVGMIGKTVYDLGGTPWNQETAMRNFNAMPVYKKAMNAFFLARLVGLSPF